jgi:uncharacterized repeat protein (TIGR01451 family)
MALALLALAILAGQAAAAPGTQTWTGGAAGATPDLERGGFSLLDAGGAVITPAGIAGTLNFTLNGTPYVGFCTDTSRIFSTSTEPVDTTTEDPPATANTRALAWILLNRAPTGASTPEKVQQAAVSQVAAWILVDAQISKTTPTTDAALNTAALALVQEALAATATPASLSVSAVAPAVGASTSTVTVFGRPGAVVTLAVTSGSASLSSTSVVIGPGGFGTSTLTATGAGTVGISASTPGDGRLFRINPTDPETLPQATAAAEPTTLAVSAQVVFQATPVTPVVPTVPVTQVPRPSVAITKTAPARARVLSNVRYRITVRNSGRVTLRNVVLRDRLPRGLSFVGASRASSLSNGSATFRIGTLAAGQSRTVIVTLMANASVTGSRVNTATVSATNVRPVSARAATVFRPLVRRVQPAVTG